MDEEYNEACADWSNVSIMTTMNDLTACVERYHKLSPERFEDLENPFIIAEYGCATGAASVLPLMAIIDAIRRINSEMSIQVILNDLPENHHSLAIETVSEGLTAYENVFIMVAGKDFTTQVFPSKTIDIGFSNMTAHIIPKAPCPRDDNVFFLISEEIKETEVG
jgi:SAM dependent carboxyl methyltransferase